MIKRSFFRFFIFFVLITFASCSSRQQNPTQSNATEVENEQDGMEQYYEYIFNKTKDPALNTIPSERLAFAQLEADRRSNLLHRTSSNLTWTERGPNNIGGRTRAVLEDKNDVTGNTIFAGSVGGGIWKCTNFKSSGYSWAKMNDHMENLAISCIAQNPTTPSIMYAGTGEGFSNADAIRGGGIFKSIDGGTTWQPLPSTIPNPSLGNISFYYVQDIAVTVAGDVYATSKGSSSCDGGVFKSIDGGDSWTKVIGASCNYCTGNDFKIAANGDLYVTTGLQGGSPGTYGRVFKSPASLGTAQGDAGQWTDITPAAPIGESGFRRIELACSPSSATDVYLLCQKYNSSGVTMFYKSLDGGTNWTPVNVPNWCDQGTIKTDFTRGQAWYDLIAAYSPTNSNRLFIGGVDLMRSTDGGQTFVQASKWSGSSSCGSYPYIHADIHNIIFLNGSLNDMVVTCDGGIFYSPDGGITYTNRNSNYNVTQYYAVAIHPTAGSNYMLAGAQDNGSHRFTNPGVNFVTTASGGDGAFCFIDQIDPTYQITSYVYSNYYISRNGGASFDYNASSSAGNFINPGDYDSRSKILYCGNSTGKFGRVINIASGIPTIETVSPSLMISKNATTFKVDPNTINRLYIGLGYSSSLNILRVDDANTTSPITSSVSIPGAYGNLSSIDVEIGDPSHLLATLSNYGVTSVYESTDGGTSWSNIEGDLPDMPVNSGVFLPLGDKRIALATELGVWTTGSAAGTPGTWVPDNDGMANVSSDMLKLRISDSTLAVATHGRGVFTTSLSAALPLKLISFTGNIQSQEGVLNWKTASESNTSHFAVEKSLDGKEYVVLANVNAAGNSNRLKTYQYIDKELTPGKNYFRLKMIDKDGKFTYSNIVLLKYEGIKNMPKIITNPFRNYIDIRFAKLPEGEVTMQLTNASGAVIKTQRFTNISQNTVRLEVGNAKLLSKSVYSLSIFTNTNKYTQQVFKE